jgi:glycosyltransferase involved in cell wall biosynthesis
LIISVITVSYNSAETIADTIKSVSSQDYNNFEYIVIDGGSSDGTQDMVRSFGNKISKFVSEPDNGIYDAINKGIRIASGDIIGILNSDDFFCSNDILKIVARNFEDNEIDAIYGDVQFVDKTNTSRIVRYYSSAHFNPDKFRFGFMPAHPSFYARRELFEKFGYYKTDYKIAADYELLIRFLNVNGIKSRYVNMPFVSMRRGGVSNRSFLSNIILNKEILRACRENGLKTNYLYIYFKYFRKIFEFIGHKKSTKFVLL